MTNIKAEMRTQQNVSENTIGFLPNIETDINLIGIFIVLCPQFITLKKYETISLARTWCWIYPTIVVYSKCLGHAWCAVVEYRLTTRVDKHSF